MNKKSVGILLVTSGVVLIGGLCWWVMTTKPGTAENPISQPISQGVAQADVAQITQETLPKIDCATAMKPLSREIVKGALKLASDEEADKLYLCSKTSKAYRNLIDGTVDTIFLFGPSDVQIQDAAKAGVEFEKTTIGYDAFVFIVNKDNPIDTISSENLRKIYSGEIKNWKELGGADEEILAYQRPKNSGSQTLMEAFMGDVKLYDVEKNLIEQDMGGLIEAVAANENSKNSIGYSVFYYANEMIANPNVKFVKVDGVYPSAETIGSKQYPITEDVYAVIRNSEEANSNARNLVRWCLTPEGQEAVNKGGYVKVVK